MSTTQIIETIRQLPIAEQRHIAHIILKDTEDKVIVNEAFIVDEEEIRTFVSNSDAFDFWQDKRENIYQDYLK